MAIGKAGAEDAPVSLDTDELMDRLRLVRHSPNFECLGEDGGEDAGWFCCGTVGADTLFSMPFRDSFVDGSSVSSMAISVILSVLFSRP